MADPKDRRKHLRLKAEDAGVVLADGQLHPLVNWSRGGFLFLFPGDEAPAPGTVLDVRLVVSADGLTVADFDVTAQMLRLNAADGTVAARIRHVTGVAAVRFEGILEECRERQEETDAAED